MDLTRTDIRYRDLEKRLGWTEDDVRALSALEPQLRDLPARLIGETLCSIDSREEAEGLGSGNPTPLDSLRRCIELWMEHLLSGPYDRDYLTGLWRIGVLQADADLGCRRIATLLLLRLRSGLVASLVGRGGEVHRRGLGALQKRLDLDQAVILDAYAAAAAAEPDSARSEREVTLQQFTGGLVHELRQPLNAIRTSAYYLGHGEALPPQKTTEHLDRIGRQVEYADQILRALSTFASLRSPAATPLSLGESLEEALERNPVSDEVQVSIGDLASIPPVLGDPGQLQIVFGNLLRNARDAMQGGGRLCIGARHVGKNVEIEVRDTGTGIAAEDLPRVLEPLFTTKARGMGLGLAVSRLILDTLGGGIRVESELGRGTTFTLTMPAATGGPKPAGPGRAGQEDPK